MPGKARRKKGKRSFQGKRGKGRLSQPTVLARQPVVAQIDEPVSSSGGPLPSASVPAPVAKPEAVQYRYISNELLTISILAGVMLIILVVLAVVPLPW